MIALLSAWAYVLAVLALFAIPLVIAELARGKRKREQSAAWHAARRTEQRYTIGEILEELGDRERHRQLDDKLSQVMAREALSAEIQAFLRDNK